MTTTTSLSIVIGVDIGILRVVVRTIPPHDAIVEFFVVVVVVIIRIAE
jgi:hypothetical protein